MIYKIGQRVKVNTRHSNYFELGDEFVITATDGEYLTDGRGNYIRACYVQPTPQPVHPDTERMDWLEKNRKSVSEYLMTNGPHSPLREVIDNARRNESSFEPDRLTRIEQRLEKLEANDGWIPWSGGSCPVPIDTRVMVKIRKGFEFEVTRPQRVIWYHNLSELVSECEIAAYKVL